MTAPAAPAAPAPARAPIDLAVRRVLRIPEAPATTTKREQQQDLHRAFSKSIVVSAARCVLTYLVLPFLAPALGFAKGVAPVIGIPLAVVAIVFNIRSIRRFWAADHKWRWGYSVIGVSVIGLLVVLIVRDLVELAT